MSRRRARLLGASSAGLVAVASACSAIVGVDFGDAHLGADAGDAGSLDGTAHDGRVDGHKSHDAGHDSSHACPSAEDGMAAVGALGCRCPTSGAFGCNGHASNETLVCAETAQGLAWQGNGACTAGNRCDTAAGPNQGTCQPVSSVCADASPGGAVCTTVQACDGGTDACAPTPESVRCGPDLLSTTPLETCVGQGCIGGSCVGVCAPSSTQCSGTLVETCDPAGMWGAPTPCGGSGPIDAGRSDGGGDGGASLEGGGKPEGGGGAEGGTKPEGGAKPEGGSPEGGGATNLCCGAACVQVCGSCSNQCPGGQCSAAGQCTMLLATDQYGGAIALDAVNAYWVDQDVPATGTASVWKAPLAGGASTALYSLAAGANGLLNVAVDATNVYWGETDMGGSFIKAVPIAGGAPVTLATTTTAPGDLVVGAADIYWSDGASIIEAPLTVGAATTLVTGQDVVGLSIDLTSNALYWINDSTSTLVKLALGVVGDAGAPVTLVTGMPDATSIAVDAGDVFWTNSTGSAGTVVAYTGATGTVTTLASGQDLPFDSPGIAVNTATVAWISREGVMSMPRAGGAISAVSANRPSGIAMTDGFLVWTTSPEWSSSHFGVFKQTPP